MMQAHEEPPALECHMFGTGHCLARESHLMRGGRRVTVECHSLVALLRHPVHGWLLWDAGYAPRMLEETRRLPYVIYRAITPLRLRPELAAAEQIGRWHLTASDIDRVIISHFHADHIAGLRDFPQARLIASANAYQGITGRHGFSALRRGMIPALLPEDFAARAELLPDFAGPTLPGLGATHDLFGDGSLLMVALPGHARGQMGMLAHTTQGEVLFAADACWLVRAIRESKTPHPITNLLVDDPRAVRTTIDHLAAFAQARPDITIIPSHCPETFARAAARWV
jgi:glyoxylase-like metal-dependent hydrolase (beta-lactamase superfamily II)